MQPYVVRQGESVATIALRCGFDGDAVWNDAKNGDLRAQRVDPLVLAPGDILYVPDSDPSSAGSTPAVDFGAQNSYAAKRPPLYARVRLVDEGGTAIANQAFTLDGIDPPVQGSTNGDGIADLELPSGQPLLRVRFQDTDFDLVVQVAYLDPVTEASGQLQRLDALGLLPALPAVFDPDAADIVWNEYLGAALAVFQQRSGLSVTGELDDATKQALGDAHGA